MFLLILLVQAQSAPVNAICGFYVGKAEGDLFNKASKVAIARKGKRTVITMANDYRGDMKEFALVVPVPKVLKKGQVNVAEPQIMQRLDSFSAPRLVEYHDRNPCRQRREYAVMEQAASPSKADKERAESLGVTIEESFQAGVYDILILSAEESSGLQTWFSEQNYKVPEQARNVLQSYIDMGMKFFVAKVNLKRMKKQGYEFLRPIQMAFESSHFMLPLKLGMVNADGPQDLVVFVMSNKGRAKVTNYENVKIPTDKNIPVFVQNEFQRFYRDLFETAYKREGRNAVFLEYAWDMSKCDPCAGDPLSREELKQAGVFWIDQPDKTKKPSQSIRPPQPPTPPRPQGNVFLTRLHVRYTHDKFPEDLRFKLTDNRDNFQGRYVIRHPYEGDASCKAATRYRNELREKRIRRAERLANLTGWEIETIKEKMDLTNASSTDNTGSDSPPWWERLLDW